MVVTDRIAVFNSLKEEIEDIIGETATFRAESEAAYRRQLRRQEVLYGAYVIRQHKRQNFMVRCQLYFRNVLPHVPS